MAAVLVFVYDCGFEISIPASRTERQELVEMMEAVADQRHELECSTCHVSSDALLPDTDVSRQASPSSDEPIPPVPNPLPD